jgi:sulfate transport system ATP-binding protein
MSFGRLLEVGAPHELYDNPRTEFVASFLGTANLLLGTWESGAVRLGPVVVRSGSPGADQLSGSRHPSAQVLFRPEDVHLRSERPGDGPVLGCGVVESVVFSGPVERIRVRLPAIGGVRAIAPPAAFGDDSIVVEASREREAENGMPVRPGDEVWVIPTRMHTLPHPGLRFVLLTDGTRAATAGLEFGGQFARLAHARAVVLAVGSDSAAVDRHLQAARESVGSGLLSLELVPAVGSLDRALAMESERQTFDLLVSGVDPSSALSTAQAALHPGSHHVLLVPRPQPVPTKALICVAAGEPGKGDVLVAGRLLRHLGAEATVLWVPGPDAGGPERERAERFLERSVRSLAALGVRAAAEIGEGTLDKAVETRVKSGAHDFLVLGAPLPEPDEVLPATGLVTRMLGRGGPECATLLVRYQSPTPVLYRPSLIQRGG